MTSPVLDAIARTAVDATGASVGWLVAVVDDTLEVVAATGTGARALIGRAVPAHAGTAGFVVASGQPIAMNLRPADARRGEGVAALLPDPPTSVVCVPCTADDGIVGALELVDKRGADSFTFDDVEVVTLLANVAGAALGHDGAEWLDVPQASALSADLQRLEEADPAQYRRVAVVCRALLDSV